MPLRRPWPAWRRQKPFLPGHAAANPCGRPSRRRRRAALWSLRKYEPAIPAKIAFFHAPLVTPRTRGACLLLPSLFVHAGHKEPKGQRSFPEDAGGKIVGGQILCELR